MSGNHIFFEPEKAVLKECMVRKNTFQLYISFYDKTKGIRKLKEVETREPFPKERHKG